MTLLPRAHIIATATALLWMAAAAPAQDVASDDNNKLSFKLTPSYYRTSDGSHASDVNLRAGRGAHTGWLGHYRDNAGTSQWRTGYEYRAEREFVRTVLSAQLAQGGFAGGSVTSELGGATYGIVGWGRTNLRSYYNLNFDPNDAITLGIGSRAFPGLEMSLFHLWDDRLPTQQQVTHAVLRYKPADSQRLTVDLARKRGLTDTNTLIRGHALSVTWDFGPYFARLARDQYVNFTDNHQTRASLGLRF